ncbi:MAG: helix-turn-helix domain-containing protein [Planctomycetota bacterium]
MLLTLTEAAVRLGKSERQVRYLVQQGKLHAEKRGGRWLIELDESLATEPTGSPQAAARHRKQAALRTAVDAALQTDADSEEPRRRYTLRNLKAFQIALPILRRARNSLGEEHSVPRSLAAVLDRLAIGCHRFERSEKAAAYQQARDLAASAVADLLVLEPDHADANALVDAIELELMPAFAGLLRRVDRRARW